MQQQMRILNPQRREAMNTNLKLYLVVAAALLASVVSLPVSAAERIEGLVIGMHNEEATDAFVKTLNLPAKHDGGRFAVVQLFNGHYGEASFALVYVPRHVAARRNDIVQIAPTELDLLKNPGAGLVLKVNQELAACR
jgi:hypothetical protein